NRSSNPHVYRSSQLTKSIAVVLDLESHFGFGSIVLRYAPMRSRTSNVLPFNVDRSCPLGVLPLRLSISKKTMAKPNKLIGTQGETVDQCALMSPYISLALLTLP